MQIQKIILVIIVIAGVALFTAALAFWLNLLSNSTEQQPVAHTGQNSVCVSVKEIGGEISCTRAVQIANEFQVGQVVRVMRAGGFSAEGGKTVSDVWIIVIARQGGDTVVAVDRTSGQILTNTSQ
jgi:hypothetical protein